MAPAGAAPVKHRTNLTRKVCLVTGAASGFGEAVSRQLASRHLHIVSRGRFLDPGCHCRPCGPRCGARNEAFCGAGREVRGRAGHWLLSLRSMRFVDAGRRQGGVRRGHQAVRDSRHPPTLPVYAATKAAVYHLGRSLGTLYPNIHVFTICPGAVQTNLKGATKVPGAGEFNQSKAIQRGLAIMQTDDVADAMIYCVDHADELPRGAALTVSPPGIALLETETKVGTKIKDVRKREQGKQKL
ncbi:hypothetical protein DFJ74DRAFT_654726 [Hyaloraphidium curvatum]|nr:hypothetical protein DFJ74DRAFT_654726 [Hyaloraphidium curvatum]